MKKLSKQKVTFHLLSLLVLWVVCALGYVTGKLTNFSTLNWQQVILLIVLVVYPINVIKDMLQHLKTKTSR